MTSCCCRSGAARPLRTPARIPAPTTVPQFGSVFRFPAEAEAVIVNDRAVAVTPLATLIRCWRLPHSAVMRNLSAYMLGVKHDRIGAKMPNGPQGQKRPADTVAAAIKTAKILTGEIAEDTDD